MNLRKHTNNNMALPRWRHHVAAATTLALLAGACASTELRSPTLSLAEDCDD